MIPLLAGLFVAVAVSATTIGTNIYTSGNLNVVGTTTMMGNVGVGTSTISANTAFEVLGNSIFNGMGIFRNDVRVDNTDTNFESSFEVNGTFNTSSAARIGVVGTTSRLWIQSGETSWPTTWTLGINTGLENNPNQDFQIREVTDGTDVVVDKARLTILKANGNVGIGTTTPQAKLDVKGSFIAGTSTISSINFGVNTLFASNNYHVAFDPPITSLQKGLQVTFIATSSNAGACNLMISDLNVVKPLKMQHDQNPVASYIETGGVVVAVYDGSSFQMIQPDANPDTISDFVVGGGLVSDGPLLAGTHDVLEFNVFADTLKPVNLKKFTLTPQLSGVSDVTISGVYDTSNPGSNLISAPIAISSNIASTIQLTSDLPIPAGDHKTLFVEVNVGSMGSQGTNRLQLDLTSSDTEYTGSDWQWNNTINWPYYNGYKITNKGILPLSGPLFQN